MSRIVLQGTSPTNMRRFTAADIPADGDLSHSFFRYVDFSKKITGPAAGRFDGNLLSVNMQNMDILDCKATGGVVTGDVAWAMSRRTDWTGATIHPNIRSDFGCADFLKEILRASGVQWAGQLRQALGNTYPISWGKVAETALTLSGEQLSMVISRAQQIFTPYPYILKRLASILAKPGVVGQDDSQGVTGPTNLASVFIEGDYYDLTSAGNLGLDRWAAARRLEDVALGLYGLRTACHVRQLEPYVNLVFLPLWQAERDPQFWQSTEFHCQEF